jgi:O-antigen/teichoic acid export membrane protein
MSEGAGGTRRAVASGAITLLSARFTVAALAMIFIAISTRILTLEEMAVFAVYSSLCAVQAMVCSLGLLTTCTRELPALTGRGDEEGASRMLRTALVTNASLSFALACGLALAARPLSLLFLKTDAYAPAFRIVAVGVFLWNLYEANQIILVALQRFGAYGKNNVICAIAQRVSSLVLFVILAGRGHGLLGYVAGYAAGTLVGVGFGLGAMKDLLTRRSGFAPLGPLLRFSAPFYADGYLRYLYMQADQLLIGIFLPPQVLSLYFVAKRFAMYYQQTVASSIDPALAKVAEIRDRGREAVAKTLRSASRYFALAFIPFAAGTAALSPFFLYLAGGEPYREAAVVLALLSISVALYAAFNLVTGYVYVLGVPADRLRHNLVTGLSQLVLMAALLALVGAGIQGYEMIGSSNTALMKNADQQSVPAEDTEPMPPSTGNERQVESGTVGRLGPLMGAAAIAVARVGALLIGLLFAQRQLKRYLTPSYATEVMPRTILAAILLAAAIAIPQAIYDHPAVVPLYALAGTGLFVLLIRPAVRPEDLDLLGDLLRGRAAFVERLARRIFDHQTSTTPAPR